MPGTKLGGIAQPVKGLFFATLNRQKRTNSPSRLGRDFGVSERILSWQNNLPGFPRERDCKESSIIIKILNMSRHAQKTVQ